MPASALMMVMVTAPSLDVAEKVITTLVEERLAACGNIVPGVTSIYRWEGAVQRETEVLIILKTTRAAVEAMTGRVAELHPYDVPEVLALPIAAGLDAYASWVAANVHG